jgi:hypothetical protein
MAPSCGRRGAPTLHACGLPLALATREELADFAASRDCVGHAFHDDGGRQQIRMVGLLSPWATGRSRRGCCGSERGGSARVVRYGLKRYPTPRTVSRWRGFSASSPMWARSRATKLSTVRAVPK